MSQVAIIFWSGTGNTEAMAKAIEAGAKESGHDVKCLDVSKATVADVTGADFVFLGCPSMGDEVLEEGEMEPFVASLESVVANKSILNFGSYGWGDGQWMREWDERMVGYGAKLMGEGFIVNETPSANDLEACKALGRV